MSAGAASQEAWILRFNEGAAHFNGGRMAEAEAAFAAAAAAKPEHPVIRLNHGMALRLLGRREEAVAAFRTALQLRGDLYDAAMQLAETLAEMGRAQEALAVHRALMAVRPDHPGAALALGGLLMRADRPELAEPAYRVAVAVDPGSATAANNLGAAIMSQRRLDDAAAVYRRAIALEPSSPEYHKNLGTCRLMAGDFQEGGREYEWREMQPVWKWRRSFPGVPRWDGGPLEGRTILVHFEQGLGDSFQFVRYMAVLKGMGARVLFECQKPLRRVLAGVAGIDALVAAGEPLPPFDCHAPLMSLPWLCGTTPETVPGGVPYIRAEPALVEAWGRRMDRGEFRIGVNWHANEANRSIPLELFAGIARIPGVRLYSLQKVVGMEQAAALRDRLGIIDWTGEMDSGPDGFVDTAAVMANMDLIISCDTAVNHLAGAMGLPALAVLRWFGDWRWMTIPDHTPWYPTMRLLRSERKNDWTGVMERAAAEVTMRAGLHRAVR